MKKLSLLVILLSVLTLSAQKKHPLKNLTNEQKTALYLKKMTLDLDLTNRQIDKIKPLIAKNIDQHQKHKTKKTTNFTQMMQKLDTQIAFHRKMKSILNKTQYLQFKELEKQHQKNKMRKKRKHKRGKKEFREA